MLNSNEITIQWKRGFYSIVTKLPFNGNEISISSLYIRTLRTYKNVKERGRINPVPTFNNIVLLKKLVLYDA